MASLDTLATDFDQRLTWSHDLKCQDEVELVKSSLPCYCLDSDRIVNKKRQDQLGIGNKAPENFSLTYKSSRNGWILTLWPQDWERGERTQSVPRRPPAHRNIWLCWVSNEFNSSIPDPAHYGALCFLATSPPNFLDRLTASLGNQQIHFSESNGTLKHHEPAGNRFIGEQRQSKSE